MRDWLHGRGFDDATLQANLVGCDPGRQLLRRRRGLPYGKVPAATFPALGPTGQVTFVQARYLDVDAAGRKYDNPAAALAPNPRLTFAATAGAALAAAGGVRRDARRPHRRPGRLPRRRPARRPRPRRTPSPPASPATPTSTTSTSC